jgi:hypothetical protein
MLQRKNARRGVMTFINTSGQTRLSGFLIATGIVIAMILPTGAATAGEQVASAEFLAGAKAVNAAELAKERGAGLDTQTDGTRTVASNLGVTLWDEFKQRKAASGIQSVGANVTVKVNGTTVSGGK